MPVVMDTLTIKMGWTHISVHQNVGQKDPFILTMVNLTTKPQPAGGLQAGIKFWMIKQWGWFKWTPCLWLGSTTTCRNHSFVDTWILFDVLWGSGECTTLCCSARTSVPRSCSSLCMVIPCPAAIEGIYIVIANATEESS